MVTKKKADVSADEMRVADAMDDGRQTKPDTLYVSGRIAGCSVAMEGRSEVVAAMMAGVWGAVYGTAREG